MFIVNCSRAVIGDYSPTAINTITPAFIFTHMHEEWHHGIISAQRPTSSPQPLTIKPNHPSQCLLSPVCISHGVALQLRTSSSLWDWSSVLTTHFYLQTPLPPTMFFSPGWHTHTQIWCGKRKSCRAQQMTQWRGEAPCVRGTNCGEQSLKNVRRAAWRPALSKLLLQHPRRGNEGWC